MHRLFLLAVFLLASQTGFAQNIFEKDFSKPEATEQWEPVPPIVRPGEGTQPPSDAIVLFDGKNMDKWVMVKDGSPSKWNLSNGVMTVSDGHGDIQTREKFGDCQLHIEFRIPVDAKDSPVQTNAGNSGVFLQERYEVQIFNSYNNESTLYTNGQMGSLYKQAIPLVNVSRKGGEWNSFDIYYTAPRFRFNGTVETPAYVTVVHNGVLILNHFEIQGTIQHVGIPRYEPHGDGSVRLQGHGSPVSFRNIWIRKL